MGQVMTPKIGQKVYCIYHDGIFRDTVGYLGKESFILDSFRSGTDEESWEWDFDTYDTDWFTSIAKAKKALLDRFKDYRTCKVRVVKVRDTWWEIEYLGD